MPRSQSRSAISSAGKAEGDLQDLVDKHAVFDAVVAKPIIADEDAKIDEKACCA